MAHSSNVIIHGSTFNSVQGDFHIHNRDSESGLHILRLGVSLGAIHDSAERSPPPNCHPGTREAVQQIILDWIYNENSTSSFFWLYGPAGAGKTAILQSIAEFLCSESGFDQNFGGSFFFSRGKQGRDRGHFLFSTIAYQLALNDVTGLRQHVNRIMETKPTLHTKSMDVQLQTLIVDPFRYLLPRPQHSYLVIIDGLDECHDKATQQSILRLLCETITVHKLPLRFIIGSRPESHIRTSFDRQSLYSITHRVVLDETFNPGRDIEVFLRDGFANISAENPILSYVEQPWPSEGIINLLVQRSSGQFIYAATVLKFVGAEFCSPTKQLTLVLKPDPTAFSDLDQLYTQILSVYPSAVNIVKILGIISVSHGFLAEAVEDIFGMEKGELKLVLRGLSSLIKDENREPLDERDISYVMSHLAPTPFSDYLFHSRRSGLFHVKRQEYENQFIVPHFAHASFSDYLFNSSRSGPFHVNRQEYENQFTIRSFALIMQTIRSWMSSITRVLPTATWKFFISHLPERFRCSPKVVMEGITTDINDLVQELVTSSDGAVGASFLEMRRLFGILQECFQFLEVTHFAQSDIEDRIRDKFKILLDGYRRIFDHSLSKSEDLSVMLKLLPGVVVQKRMSLHGMAVLYRIKPGLLERLINFTIEPLKPSPFDSEYEYILDDYLSCFLQDRDRSQLHYCDPMLQHISICCHFLSLMDGSNAINLQSRGLSGYVYCHFNDHLYEATMGFLYAQNNSDDHPAVEILHNLETTAYYVGESLSDGPGLARFIIKAILKWANKLNCRLKDVAVSVSDVDLLERVCHLTNKIYREILCISRRSGHEGMVITIHGLDHSASWTMQYRVVLSWDLLAWISAEDRILSSFTNFITTPELSGALYISPGFYHSQITEYSLRKIHKPSSFRHCVLHSNRSFREHLSRAVPTEIIFHLLRSIPSERLVHAHGDFGELLLDTLEIIIEWLQGLGSERPSDLYDRFQGEVLQYKNAPSLPQSRLLKFDI